MKDRPGLMVLTLLVALAIRLTGTAFAAEQLRAARFALDQFLQQRQSRLELLVLRVDFRRHQQDFRVLIVLVDKTLKAAGRFIGPSQAVQRRSAAIKKP